MDKANSAVGETKNADRAIGLAEEYKALVERGDVVRAEETRRTIEDLHVGSYVGGRWVIREDIRRAMGLLHTKETLSAIDVARINGYLARTGKRVASAGGRSTGHVIDATAGTVATVWTSQEARCADLGIRFGSDGPYFTEPDGSPR